MTYHRDTRYGFDWGAARVQRCVSDERWGVLLEVTTPRQHVEIRVTPSGLIRVGDVKRGKSGSHDMDSVEKDGAR